MKFKFEKLKIWQFQSAVDSLHFSRSRIQAQIFIKY